MTLRDELDELIECARQLGVTQSKRGLGIYTQTDARFERAMHEAIEKHKAALAQPESEPSDRKALAANLRSSAAVDGSHHHQADWQRIAQLKAAELLEADAEAYEQGRYDESMAQGPNPWPDDLAQQVAVPQPVAYVPLTDDDLQQCATAEQYFIAANMRNGITAGEYANAMRKIMRAIEQAVRGKT